MLVKQGGPDGATLLALWYVSVQIRVDGKVLGLADAVHLGATNRARALCGGPAILQCYLLRPLHFPLGSALQAVRLHIAYLLLKGTRLPL